ncbi:RANBP2-like and GRIP domain-containing protein 8 [Lagopus muta]|uniref:RANBP2-like and GRIP domain-containing protein 8 n=1 Tax=Lagopus muta TaxID=64668 RepID=UPI00209E4AB2|nr:RANBP2-like and GRIP domain-containing protein 8 [Lagopus muta]
METDAPESICLLVLEGISLNSYDQKEYIGRSVYYWKNILFSLKTIKKHRSIPEPADPLFKHFHNVDIQLCQRKAEEVESDDMLPEEQEERKAYLVKRKHYLMKIIDENSSDPSVVDKLPVSVKAVMEMLNAVIRELGENDEEGSLASGNISRAAHVEMKYSVPSPKKFSFSPTNTYQALPQWAEDHKSLLQKLCQQMEALKLLPLAHLFTVASHLLVTRIVFEELLQPMYHQQRLPEECLSPLHYCWATVLLASTSRNPAAARKRTLYLPLISTNGFEARDEERESPRGLLPKCHKFSLASTMQQMSPSQDRVLQFSMSFLLLQNRGNSQAIGPNSVVSGLPWNTADVTA